MGLIRALEREGEILATEPVADLSDAETVETVLYTSVSKQVEADCTDTGKNQKESGRGRGGEREREREREREGGREGGRERDQALPVSDFPFKSSRQNNQTLLIARTALDTDRLVGAHAH